MIVVEPPLIRRHLIEDVEQDGWVDETLRNPADIRLSRTHAATTRSLSELHGEHMTRPESAQEAGITAQAARLARSRIGDATAAADPRTERAVGIDLFADENESEDAFNNNLDA